MRNFFTAPALVDIALTNRCNLKCNYCSASSGESTLNNNELTLHDYKTLFKDLDKMNVHRISLSGGEPFVRSDFFEILKETQQYSFAKIINTNGILITDSISKELTKYNFDRICVTIDGSTPQIHDSIRGNNSFKLALNGIQNLQKYNLPVSTLFTLHPNNVNNLIYTIKLNESLGIEYMSVMVVCPTGRASNGSSLLTKEQWYPVFLELSEMLKSNKIKLKFKIVPPNESSIFWLFYFPLKHYNRLDLLSVWNQSEEGSFTREISCQAGIKSCSITSNGDVYGCDLMIGIDEFKVGNILTSSLNDIWLNSPVFSKLRSITFDSLNGKCKNCDNLWCGAGCRSAAYNLTGSIYGSDESCFLHKEV